MTELESDTRYLDPWHQDVLNLLSSIEEELIELNAPEKWQHKHTAEMYAGNEDWELVAVTQEGFYWKRRIL